MHCSTAGPRDHRSHPAARHRCSARCLPPGSQARAATHHRRPDEAAPCCLLPPRPTTTGQSTSSSTTGIRFVQHGHRAIRSRGHDRERADRLALRRTPSLPNAGKCQLRPVTPPRWHTAACRPPPPSTRRTPRTARSYGVRPAGATEHPGRAGRLRPSVDRLARRLQVLGEVRDQTPLQHVQPPLARLGVPAHHHRTLGRRHVPARSLVRQRARRPEQLRHHLRR